MTQTLKVNNHSIAYIHQKGNSPHLLWCGGFRSDMSGTKAETIATLGYEYTRFDYSGHGKSSGAFLEGTIGQWYSDAKAIYEMTPEPKIIIGSSMGGWIALKLAIALAKAGTPVKALLLIAPAPDFTEKLMWHSFTNQQKAELHEKGIIYEPSEYDAQGTPITLKLIEEARNHLLMSKPIQINAPVQILAGEKDESVPLSHVLELASLIQQDPLTVTIVKNGDHRLSRDEDLELMVKSITSLAK